MLEVSLLDSDPEVAAIMVCLYPPTDHEIFRRHSFSNNLRRRMRFSVSASPLS